METSWKREVEGSKFVVGVSIGECGDMCLFDSHSVGRKQLTGSPQPSIEKVAFLNTFFKSLGEDELNAIRGILARKRKSCLNPKRINRKNYGMAQGCLLDVDG